MKVLGIETSCDETAAAVVEDGCTLLGQMVASQMDLHARFGGVVPEVASRQHVEHITRVIAEAMRDAAVTWADLDGIAVTCGPGLLGSLLVGVSAAKSLALATGLPLVPVHHIAGHVAAALIDRRAALPFLALVVSGGHTELLWVDGSFRFRKLGGTQDDAAGEAYDKVARMVGLPYPGGPAVDHLATTGNPAAYAFPRSMMDESNYDFSFSGLKTAVLNEVNRLRQQGQPIPTADLCASFQAAVIDVLVAKTMRAAKETGAKQLVVAGGVAANRGLRAALTTATAHAGLPVHFPPLALCTDNAAMIAAAGCLLLAQGRTAGLDLDAYANLTLSDWQESRFPVRR
ncbi:MAG: tRNA (adenosine(37)-N6)-threonylcarbamoyltransferase complex transferase subunit TsaD [Alicyclobacillus sp.]|nr:tRNA (adenosine(37)-N6)-threonylcarbamoyltransferase complex transferase subunit TsaD [Alicyclobacillus sp.]